MEIIDSFQGEHSFLSNFHPCTVFTKGMAFPSVEHGFVAWKSNDPNFWTLVRSTVQPGKVKRMGRKIQLIPNWDNIKLNVMQELLRSKFSYPDLRQKLLNTNNATLIEGNYWHDQYWGDCRCKKHSGVPGRNMLGKLLMKIRSELQNG